MKATRNAALAVLASVILCCAQTAPTAGAALPMYVIGPLDVLSIKVRNEPKLSGNVNVGADGMISIPSVGAIQAAGLTHLQLKDAIAKSLEGVLLNPDVSVQLLRSNRIKPSFPLLAPSRR